MTKTYLHYLTALLVLATIVCSVPFLSPAHAADEQYTVTYNQGFVHYVENLPAAQTASAGTSLVLSDTIPASPECRFMGWSVIPYGEVIYQPGDSYTEGKDITLYAVWVLSCGVCRETGQKTVTCSLCNGTGDWWGNVSECCSSRTTLVSVNHGSTYYLCLSCGKACDVEYGRADCEKTMKVLCETCYGDTYVKYTPTAPQPQLLSSTGTSITVVAQAGMEYSIDGYRWQSSNTFTGLEPCTSYTVYQRYPGSTYYEVGERSRGLKVSTTEQIPSAPEAPFVEAIYHNKIVLRYDYSDSYEYSMDGISWTSNNIFENLEPNTAYTFYQRTKATATSSASEASAGVTVSTAGCGTLAIGSASGAPGETVTLNLNMPVNPHLNYLYVGVAYDPQILELIAMDDKGLLSGFTYYTSNGGISLYWEDRTLTANNTSTGTILSLSFKILKAPQDGYTPVSISNYYSTDTDYKNNGFSVTSGKIDITCKVHEFGEYHTDTGTHWRTCSNCGYKETGDHEFRYTCDGTCSICHQYIRNDAHDLVMKRDKSGHWYECSICKTTTSLEPHIPGPEATEQTPQTCLECGHIITPVLSHEHEYDPNLTADSQGHWHACFGCDEKYNYAEHRYENACSTACSDCGFGRKTEHQYAEDWQNDKDAHWHACVICGDMTDIAAHTPGPEATETEAQTCTVCGYELSPAVPSQATEPTDPTGGPTRSTNPPQNNMLLWIVIACIVIGGGVALIIIKAKKAKS